MITNINSYRPHYNESWSGISLSVTNCDICHILFFMTIEKSVTEILLKSVTCVTFVTPMTCGSGPLLCMAVTSLNFLLAIYKVFEDPIWGLNNNNNNLNLL